MATPATLVVEGKLVAYTSNGTAQGERKLRHLFLSPSFTDQLENEELDRKERGAPLTPYDQYAVFSDQYCFEQGFKGTGQFVRLHPQWQGVFEIKVGSLRLFGWFYRKHQLILNSLGLKALVKGSWSKTGEHVEQAIKFRKTLHLDPPDYVSDDKIGNLL